MAQVRVRMQGRDYAVACEDGQENRLIELARQVDRRMGEIAAAVGDVGETRLLLMTALMLADEIDEAYRRIETLGASDAARLDARHAREEDALAEALENVAERIEAVALRLEGD